jgi:DNA-binding NtrC family response regulator
MKILVVDGDRNTREYLEDVLGLMGNRVTCVADGYAAIDYVREHSVNLAYIDINLPGMDGFETLKKIREIDRDVSGVMISGDNANKILSNEIEKGIYVYLKKPFTIEQLVEINRAYNQIKDPLEFISDSPFSLDSGKISGAKVLIADDEKEIRTIILEHLLSEGFKNLETAKDGEDAIDRFDRTKFDVAILDIFMPTKSGIDVLRHIKAFSENTQVIILTAKADKDMAINAVNLGAYYFIEKPFDLYVLSRITKMAIERKLFLDERKETL